MNNNNEINFKFDVKGFYNIKVMKKDGSVVKTAVAEVIDNLITDIGLDALGGRYGKEYMKYCYVGSGNTAPSFTDTQLSIPLASANYDTASVQQGRVFGTIAVDPYYTYLSRTYRFAEGVAAGNIAEVGVGWAGGNLFSRALIVDEFGTPTTLTVLSDEILDVTYNFRYYPSLVDTSGTVVFTGNIGGTYDWVFRIAGAGDFGAKDSLNGWGLFFGPSAPNYADTYHNTIHNRILSNSSYVWFSSEIMGTITALRTTGGTSIRLDALEDYGADPYVDGSHEVSYFIQLGLNNANLASGIKTVLFERMGIGSYQMEFTPAIPKTNFDKLRLGFKISWGRYTG